jgi:hypothetical protein
MKEETICIFMLENGKIDHVYIGQNTIQDAISSRESFGKDLPKVNYIYIEDRDVLKSVIDHLNETLEFMNNVLYAKKKK